MRFLLLVSKLVSTPPGWTMQKLTEGFNGQCGYLLGEFGFGALFQSGCISRATESVQPVIPSMSQRDILPETDSGVCLRRKTKGMRQV